MTDKRAELFKCAKELFSANGFKETNVADITKTAGMAVGTFYNYYPSKEKLFLDIFLEENLKLKNYIMDSVDLNGEPLQLIHDVIRLNFDGMSSNPILREWYNRDVFGKIEQLFRTENGLDSVGFLYGSFFELVQKWQTEGKMRKDLDPELIMAIFSAIINIDMHKDEIGLKYFPQVVDYISEFIIKGLTDKPK
jgi:AcrR family transcriptional regulator